MSPARKQKGRASTSSARTGWDIRADSGLRRDDDRSILDQRHLRHVDAATAEAAFAIHQIIAPELVERLVEAGGEPLLGDGALVAHAPAPQRFRIMEAVAL